jgi:hypothetical protein
MSTENTTAINDKKSGDKTKDQFKTFISNFLSSIILTIGVTIFIVGGLGLYTTKVVQANLLPDDIELAPFTVFDRVVKDIPIDINIMRPSFFSENKETISQKAIFETKAYLDSFSNGFLCSLKENADVNSGLFANIPLFFSMVYDEIVAKNFYFMNKVFLYFSYLPESIIMLLYGIFGIFIWIILYFWNVAISIFYHFINIPNFFRDSENGKWESQDNISFLRFTKFILFFFIGIPISFMSSFVAPIIFTIYALIAPLYATYKLQKTNKSCNVGDFIKDTFSYKKFYFFVLVTFSLIYNGATYLSPYSLAGIAIAIVFAYVMGLYTNKMPQEGVDGFTVKIRQIVKQASVEPINVSNPKLVEICKQIPIADASLENKIKKGFFRPKTVLNGGDDINTDANNDVEDNNTNANNDVNNELSNGNGTNNNGTNNNETNNNETNKNTFTTSSIHSLTNKEALETRLEQLMQQLDTNPRSQNEITNEIDDIKQQLKSFGQQGGKKRASTKHNKKYNIRLV